MKLVLTNDDGILAPGILALERACQGWCDLAVVAPERCHSSMSHCVTGSLIETTEVMPNRFRVAGSPADCARLARIVLAADATLLVSGINRGGNLGMDACYSGTIAAAREAALLGLPSIAISHLVVRDLHLDWELATLLVKFILNELIPLPIAAGEFWNVNLPHLPDGAPAPKLVFCPSDPSPLPVAFEKLPNGYRYTGDYKSRQRVPGHDVAECFAGNITATRLSLRNGF